MVSLQEVDQVWQRRPYMPCRETSKCKAEPAQKSNTPSFLKGLIVAFIQSLLELPKKAHKQNKPRKVKIQDPEKVSLFG